MNSDIQSLAKNFDGEYFYTETEMAKAKNYLRYKIVNNTDVRQLLIFDPHKSLFGNLTSRVQNKNGKIKKCEISILDGNLTREMMDELNCILVAKKMEQKRYEEFNIKDIATYLDYSRNSIVLNPHEERIFESIIYLPVISSEPYEDPDLAMYSDLEGSEMFSIVFKMNANEYKKSLPPWELKELQNKGINFYNDSIISNSIPLKLVK